MRQGERKRSSVNWKIVTHFKEDNTRQWDMRMFHFKVFFIFSSVSFPFLIRTVRRQVNKWILHNAKQAWGFFLSLSLSLSYSLSFTFTVACVSFCSLPCLFVMAVREKEKEGVCQVGVQCLVLALNTRQCKRVRQSIHRDSVSFSLSLSLSLSLSQCFTSCSLFSFLLFLSLSELSWRSARSRSMLY